MYLTNGEKYIGQFKDDNMHGKGQYFCQNGNIIEGVWENNRLLE
jgi:hypothetical protein